MSSSQVARRCLDFVKVEQSMITTTRQSILRAMEKTFGFSHSCYLLDDFTQPFAAHNVDRRMVNDYIAYFHRVNPLVHTAAKDEKKVRSIQTAGMDAAGWKQSEFFESFLSRYGFYYITMLDIDGDMDSGPGGQILIFRTRDSGDFTRDDMEAMDWLADYLGVRLRRQRDATQAKDYATLLEASLQQVQFGYLLMDENYSTLFCNTAMRDYAAQIMGTNRPDDHELIESFKDSMFNKLQMSSSVTTRPWQFTMGAYSLYGYPLFPYTSSINVALKRYVVCVYRNDAVHVNEVKRLVNRYHLTKREREIVELLQRGYSNSQIAKELCISENTAKVHLRNIYAKMEVRSRSEVLALLGTFAGISRMSPEFEHPSMHS